MDLLTNAVESIQVGVADYLVGTRPRLLSAVRNIHAGILLLYKEALRRESPDGSNDVLLMAKIRPSRDSNGKVVFVGQGKNTVDTQQIRERLEALGIQTDWKRFERISEARKEVEHLYPRLDQEALKGLVSDSFIIVRDFIATELDDDSRKLLSEETWQTMLDVAEVHQREREECQRIISKMNWSEPVVGEGVPDLTCPSCSGALLKPIEDSSHEITLQCISCGEEQSPETYVPKALAHALRHEAYVAMDDGGDSPVARCPECGKKTFLTDEWRCALCGAEPERRCDRCCVPIPVEELDSAPLCGYCQYVMNKDD